MSLRIPPSQRLENPPPVFVGRVNERKLLREALARSPVVVLWGFTGMGKSALLAQVFKESFAEDVARTLVIDCGAQPDDPVAAALRALARAASAELDWATTKADPVAAAEALIELAEAGQAVVVLENVASVDEVTRQALSTIRRFSRSMKLVLVSREDPRVAELSAQTFAVGPMPEADLLALLRHHRGELTPSEVRLIVDQAKGSPWRLLQLLVGQVDDGVGPERSLLQLAPAAQGLLRTLSLVPSALPFEELERVVRLPPSDAVTALARRGYLEVSPAGLRLHDAARPFVNSTWTPGERAVRVEKLLAVLSVGASETAAMGALTLAFEAGRDDLARELVLRRGQALLDAGYAAPVARLLSRHDTRDEDLYTWWCRASREAGGAELHAVSPPPPGSGRAAATEWAEVLLARGDAAAALGVLESADILASSLDEALPRARCLLGLGRFDEALQVLERVPVRDDGSVDELRARALLGLGSTDAARGPVTALLDRLGEESSAAARATVAELLLSCGEPSAALALAEPLVKTPGARLSAAGRRATLTVARALFRLGRVDEALRLASDARPSGATTELGAALALVGLFAKVLRGELDDVDAALDELEARSGASRWLDPEARCRELREELRRLRAAPLIAQDGALRRARFAKRAADASRLTRAALSLASGDVDAALTEAMRARVAAADAGRKDEELEAQSLVVDAFVLGGNAVDVERAASLLATMAEHVGSARYRREADLLLAHARGTLDARLLSELSRGRSRAPVAARRAKALLGDEAPLDAIDRRVVDALRAAARDTEQVRSLAGSGEEWVVDAARQRLVLPDGTVVDLAKRKVLLDLLVALCEQGGGATKEQLLARVWAVKDYNPLDHDNRLKVAVRKLRRLLEEALGEDPLVAAEDGYRLQGRVRFVPSS